MYVTKERNVPRPLPGAEWQFDTRFNAADELLRDPELKTVIKAALREGADLVYFPEEARDKAETGQMKARPPKDWSQNELERLEDGAKMKARRGGDREMLGRPTASVRRMAQSLGLMLYKKRRKAPIAAAR